MNIQLFVFFIQEFNDHEYESGTERLLSCSSGHAIEYRADVLQGMPSERTAADLAYLLHNLCQGSKNSTVLTRKIRNMINTGKIRIFSILYYMCISTSSVSNMPMYTGN